MVITEEKVLVGINHHIEPNTFEVKWENRVLRDGDVIASTPHRCAYALAQHPSFSSDIGVEATTHLEQIAFEVKSGCLTTVDVLSAQLTSATASLTTEQASHAATQAALTAALDKLAATGIV